jgi:hypothetical protein
MIKKIKKKCQLIKAKYAEAPVLKQYHNCTHQDEIHLRGSQGGESRLAKREVHGLYWSKWMSASG